jgi:hypothetical protein
MTFCHCGLKNEKGRIRCVKGWHIHLAMAATLMTSLVIAEDFKTIAGKEYKGATITRVEGDGIVVRSKTGISKIYFIELPKDVQEKFHHIQATPNAVQRERDPNELQAEPGQAHGSGNVVVVGKGSGHRQSDASGRVVVVGQSAGSVKIFIAGIVLLVVVVLAIVRSRF